MKSFFKYFGASFLALLIFSVCAIFFLISFLGGMASKSAPAVPAKGVLMLDLSQAFAEQSKEDFANIINDKSTTVPGLYDVIRLIKKAKSDTKITGIYLKANTNPNSFAANNELRNALLDFKTSNKFIIAYGETMSQSAYSVANTADSLFLSPRGMLDWSGYSVTLPFFKELLNRMNIEPEIFYAGKFKSATEPFRETQMTPANRLQTIEWLGGLYDQFLSQTAQARGIDTAVLRELANTARIQTAADAKEYKLVDDLRYDDEVKALVRSKAGVTEGAPINFITVNAYNSATLPSLAGGDKIALIYAAGDIIDGKGKEGQEIGSENYVQLIRKARLDKNVKAIVLRVNSGGGSALASEHIWRELKLTKEEKPVIVSFGDVAASGGYYIAAAADSIFAQPSTITGSIGVFGMLINTGDFLAKKVGVTFDRVKTAPYADMGSPFRSMNEQERKFMQTSIDLTYSQFKERVAEGRKLDTAYVDSIAQGRVWTGVKALELGLVDRIGGIEDAVKSAAAKAGIEKYAVEEFPKTRSLLEQLVGSGSAAPDFSVQIKEQIGEENYRIFEELRKIRVMTNGVQARMPFQFQLGQ